MTCKGLLKTIGTFVSIQCLIHSIVVITVQSVVQKLPVEKRTIQNLPDRLPLHRNVTSSRNSSHDHGKEGVFFHGSGEDSHIDLRFFGKHLNNVHFWQKCSSESVENVVDNEMFIVSSRPDPNPYSCTQKFKAGNSTSVLHLTCYSLDLRFSCSYEVLRLKVNDDLYVLCNGDSAPVQFAGGFIDMTYERRLFGLHGGYTCALVSRPFTRPQGLTASCGISMNGDQDNDAVSLKVVDGKDAVKDDFPWMAVVNITAKNYSFLCGGTLVSEHLVVTAAHCLSDNIKTVSVGLGKLDISNKKEKGSIWVTSNNFSVHPEFDRFKIINDIGVIVLPKKVSLSQTIRPACLPTEEMGGDIGGYVATAIGWGSKAYGGPLTNILQKVDLKIMTNVDCKKAWSEFGVSIQDTELCALSDGKDTCNGDSGGPLLVKLEGRWVFIGITSYGFECAKPGVPGVYTRVSRYLSWLDQFMTNNKLNL